MPEDDTPPSAIPEWTLGDRLAKSRRSARIGQEQMADLLLRNKNTMSNWENDRTRPGPKLLARWAEITGVDLSWLVGRDSVRSRCVATLRTAMRGLRAAT